jgi:DNA-directed RNA polymerase subunit M/transcription elongation factor TFIIS
MKFCELCNNILDDITTPTELYYQCTKCNKKTESSDEDTLVFEQDFNKKENSFELLLENAAFDVVNPKKYKECIVCNNQIVSYVIIGDSMKYVYVCSCGNKFY